MQLIYTEIDRLDVDETKTQVEELRKLLKVYNLTKYKIYDTIDSRSDNWQTDDSYIVKVKCDDGENRWIPRRHFTAVDEWRNNIIDKIL